MRIELPDPCLVVLIGATGSGRSTFAARHLADAEIVTGDAPRIAAGRRPGQLGLTVSDAPNVRRDARRPLLLLARDHDLPCVAIVLDLPESLCRERSGARADVRRQCAELKRSLPGLRREGFHLTWVLTEPEMAEVIRVPLPADRRTQRGPFDVIGDVHGCRDELVALLRILGYAVDGEAVTPPEGRRAVFVGDYVDRGPDTPGVLRLVMAMAADGTALCVPGNHDAKLARKLAGRSVQITHGLERSMLQLAAESPEFRERVRAFVEGLPDHVVLHDGELVVAHAGMKERYQGRSSGRVRNFALFGETTGETDGHGLPVRSRWAEDYCGSATVVFGHTPVAAPRWLNDTVNIDTGCVFGGALTALRWPERELVSVPARRAYYEPARPFLDVPGDSGAP